METEGRCTGAMTSQRCVRREVAVGRLRRSRKEARQRFLIRSITSWGKLAGLSSFEGCFPLSLKGATGFSCSEAVSHSLVNKSGCGSESEARQGPFFGAPLWFSRNQFPQNCCSSSQPWHFQCIFDCCDTSLLLEDLLCKKKKVKRKKKLY